MLLCREAVLGPTFTSGSRRLAHAYPSPRPPPTAAGGERDSRRARGSGPAMALSDWFPARLLGRQGIVGPASENRGFLTRPLACYFDVTDSG